MKKVAAVVMVMVLMAGAWTLAEAQEPVSLEITGIGLSSNFFGDYQEVGTLYGVSGGVNFEDFLVIRGLIAKGPQRVAVNNSWVKFTQHDKLTELKFLGDLTLSRTCGSEFSLRPGLVVGNKTVITEINQKWNNQTRTEYWTESFLGPVLELGFEKGQLSTYLGVQAIPHESCCRQVWDSVLYAGLGFQF